MKMTLRPETSKQINADDDDARPTQEERDHRGEGRGREVIVKLFEMER
jgi:hypothetical protein